MAKRKTYSQEFKLEAVQKWQSSGQSAVEIESELDLSSGSLYRWKNELAAELDSSAASEPAPEPTSEPVPEPEVELAEEKDVTPEEQSDDPPIESPGEDAGNGEEQPDEAELDLARGEEAVALEDSEPLATLEEAESAKIAEQESSHRPSLVKRIAGVIAVVLGGIGIILSIAAIVAVWVVNKPITDKSVEILTTVEVALDVVEENLVRADQAMQTVRDSIADVVAELPTEELGAIVANLQSLVDSVKTTAETAKNVVGFASSIPFLGPGKSQETSSTENLDQLTELMVQLSTGLESVQQLIAGLAGGGNPGGIIETLDDDLAQLQSQVNNAETTVNEAGAAVVEIRLNLPRWIDIASVVLTLLLLWLGIAQYSLLNHGWTWFRV